MRVRVPPLAIVFALMAAALVVITAWTHSIVGDAFDSVREGQALAMRETVLRDLGELEGASTSDALDTIVRDHTAAGLRYVGLLDNRATVFASSGTALGHTPPRGQPTVTHVGGRIRAEARVAARRGHKSWWIVIEVDPGEAAELEAAASRNVWIGSAAALGLLGVAIALVRRELRRAAEERAREHERRLAALGEMSAVLAHEIKNPLASLKGNAQLLASAIGDNEKARAKADRVVDEAKRLEKLTQELLAFVRTGELQREEVDVGEVVRAAAGSAEVDVTAGTWSLDRERMREVIANLVDNGVAAGPPVRVTARVEGERLAIEVADKGPGVPEAERAKIFEPFVTGKTRGTGLGLAIARRIVEAHGGVISVRNEGGAVFRVEIPRTAL
jgi:two-component system sensor histidine kinase HydH